MPKGLEKINYGSAKRFIWTIHTNERLDQNFILLIKRPLERMKLA